MFEFNALSKEEMSIKAGQKVLIAPQCLQPKNLPGWWLASNTVKVGLIPSNYVTISTVFKIKSDPDEPKNPDTQSPTNFAKENMSENEFDISLNNSKNGIETSEEKNVELEM